MSRPPRRPVRFTPKAIIAALVKSRGLISSAARSLGCDRKTITRACRKYPKVRATLHEQRELQTDRAELRLFKAIDAGQAWAITLYLKTIGRQRGYSEKLDLEGALRHERVMEIDAGAPEEIYQRSVRRARVAGATPVLVIGGDKDSYIRGLRRSRGEPGDAPTDYDDAEGNNGT